MLFNSLTIIIIVITIIIIIIIIIIVITIIIVVITIIIIIIITTQLYSRFSCSSFTLDFRVITLETDSLPIHAITTLMWNVTAESACTQLPQIP